MAIRQLLARANVAITKQSTFDRLVMNERLLLRNGSFPDFAKWVRPEFLHAAIELLPFSRGEIFQDIFAALIFDRRHSGFFVEFGATDGLWGSNSLMFETRFGWRGILSEPARVWHERLRRNRTATICEKCVWAQSNQWLQFREARDGGLSTLADFVAADRHVDKRQGGRNYKVETISLSDLLLSHGAPRVIDFLSIDTEGSEFDILQAFDFSRWEIGILTVEHNFRPEREKIFALMAQHGYTRAPAAISKFDDWYVSRHHAPRLSMIFDDEVLSR